MTKKGISIIMILAVSLYIMKPMIVKAKSVDEEILYQAYINFSDTLYEMNISTSICVEDFISGYIWNEENMIEQYVDILVEKEKDKAAKLELIVKENSLLESESESEMNSKNQSRAAVKQWYDNIGTTSVSLPEKPSYNRYNILSTVQKGDIIEETLGLVASITGHIAIVEGKFWDSQHQQYYIRTIEAGIDGVVRGVFDDTRYIARGAKVHYVISATSSQKNGAVSFCVGQLGKPYGLGIPFFTSCEYSSSTKDWYCSELVWAAYYNQGININGNSIPTNIFMPEIFSVTSYLARRSVS